MSLRVCITGSSGRIGQVLVRQLHEDFSLVGFDRQAAELPDGVAFVQGDVFDREALGRAIEGADAVVHLAAIPYDIPPLHEVFHINMQGTYNALELAAEAGVQNFLYASSIMAYGFGQNAEPQYLPIDEAHPLLADRPYGLSKILGEQLCRSFTERCGLKTLCFRLTTAVDLAASGQRRWLPWEDRRGEVGIHQYFDMRDFAALVRTAVANEKVQHDAFLVSAADSGHGRPTPELIQDFYPQAELRYDELEASSPLVSIDKARQVFGFEPRYSWRQEATP